MARQPHILIVEDNKADVFLIREAIEAAQLNAELHFVQDGEKAIRFMDEADRDETSPCPSLVLIDINLPRKHGGEVLAHMRGTRRCAKALVLIVTSSDSGQDRDEMLKLGATEYFRKPSVYDEFMRLGQVVSRMLDALNDDSTPKI